METIHKERLTMTISEASEYSGIGQNRLRELSAAADCPWVLHVGRRILVKVDPFKEYLMKQNFV